MSRPEDLQNWALRDNISLGRTVGLILAILSMDMVVAQFLQSLLKKTILPHILEQLKMVN